jgi:tetratricopeptide (TPR) repeat protein
MVLRKAGVLAGSLGHIEEAIGFYHRALEQDPLSSASYQNLALMLRAANRMTEAEAAFRKALELAPHRTTTRALLSLTLLAQGRGDEAMAEAMGEPSALRIWALAIVHHALGHAAESNAAQRELIEKHAGDHAYQIAEVHGARGEAIEAFEWLERAYAQRDGGINTLKTSPLLRSLHGNPRWDSFLKKLGLAD